MVGKQWAAGIVGVALAAVAVAPAGTIRHDRADSQYTTLANSYPSVGLLQFIDPNDASVDGTGSGTLITPEWVLTAGHVSSALTSHNLNFTIDGQTIPIVERVTHLNFNGNIEHGYDIGLVRLATPVTTVTPAQRFTGTALEEFDITATYVGFGRTGTGVTGATQPEGTKRAGQNLSDLGFENDENQLHFFGSDFDDPPTGGGYTNDGLNVGLNPAPLDLEYCTAPGDSGGGVFVDLGAGPLVAGVLSFGVSPPFITDGFFNSDYSDLIFATRVAIFNSFINATIPEPAALALLALPAVLCRRRRA